MSGGYAKNWWHTGPFAGTLSGFYYSTGFDRQGYTGYFWSSSAYSNNYIRDFNLSYAAVGAGTGNAGSKIAGGAVRCVI
jgi:hypothetical protein